MGAVQLLHQRLEPGDDPQFVQRRRSLKPELAGLDRLVSQGFHASHGRFSRVRPPVGAAVAGSLRVGQLLRHGLAERAPDRLPRRFLLAVGAGSEGPSPGREPADRPRLEPDVAELAPSRPGQQLVELRRNQPRGLSASCGPGGHPVRPDPTGASLPQLRRDDRRAGHDQKRHRPAPDGPAARNLRRSAAQLREGDDQAGWHLDPEGQRQDPPAAALVDRSRRALQGDADPVRRPRQAAGRLPGLLGHPQRGAQERPPAVERARGQPPRIRHAGAEHQHRRRAHARHRPSSTSLGPSSWAGASSARTTRSAR